MHKPYEFGVKTGLVTTLEGNWIVGVRTFPGNPHDSVTLRPTLEQTARLTGVAPTDAYVDKGYRGCDVRDETRVHMARQRYGTPSRTERRRKRRRAAIEPIIGHTKHDHRMIRCHLRGSDGDAINATLAACGFNLSKLLRAIRVRVFVLVPERLFSLIRGLKMAIFGPRPRWFASAVA